MRKVTNKLKKIDFHFEDFGRLSNKSKFNEPLLIYFSLEYEERKKMNQVSKSNLARNINYWILLDAMRCTKLSKATIHIFYGTTMYLDVRIF